MMKIDGVEINIGDRVLVKGNPSLGNPSLWQKIKAFFRIYEIPVDGVYVVTGVVGEAVE